MPQYSALVVTSDPATADHLRTALDALGLTSEVAGSISQAVVRLSLAIQPRLLVADSQLSDGDVLDFMARHTSGPSVAPVIVLARPDAQHLTEQAILRGAIAALALPFDAVTLQRVVARALVRRERRDLPAGPRPARSSPFLGESRAVEALTKDIERAAQTDLSVLIQGETGTGKGVLARWIHDLSPRAREPYIDVNCAALSKELFESEICGFEKGAFTGATSTKVGLLEAAHGGTMFLDEFGDLAPDVQPRMLKLIEDKRCRRLGSVREQQCDVRFVAASNHDLDMLVRERRFRADLFFRMNSLTVVCPPLRDRGEDVLVLAASFLASVSRQLHRPGLEFSREAIDALIAHSWPGNVRELLHVVERAALMSEGDAIGREHLRLSAAHTSQGGLAEHKESTTLEALQVRHIQMVLDAEAWNVERSARLLGLARSTLYQKIKQHRLSDRLRDTGR